MFENLTEKLQETFRRLINKGRLSEGDVDDALREVRLALLEADVNYRVAREFTDRVQARAVGAEVARSLSPGQQVIKIVNEELIGMLGEASKLDLSGPWPHIIMLVGLQGSGKTTTVAKLALHLRQQGQRPLMVAADTRRPAAIAQLEVLGKQVGIPVYRGDGHISPPDICADALRQAREDGHSVLVLDTAGRLHIDEPMMRELEEIKRRIRPGEMLLVADAMTGQDAVRVAQDFHRRVELTGLILTKLDGDARGGAAISMRAVTNVPIKFLGVGEKLEALEIFYPDRLASRILGMGDVLSLIEKAEATFEREQALRMERKLRTASFDLEDFLEQLRQVKGMGALDQLLEMIPGMSGISRQIPAGLTERQLKKVEAIISSMTREERQSPRIINASRKRRIARGSGTTIQEVNELLRQFRQMQRLMKQFMGGRGSQFISMFRNTL